MPAHIRPGVYAQTLTPARPSPPLPLQLAAGGTLKNLILNQMINPTRKLYSLGGAVRWGAQIAEGLAHLHSINPMVGGWQGEGRRQ